MAASAVGLAAEPFEEVAVLDDERPDLIGAGLELRDLGLERFDLLHQTVCLLAAGGEL